MTLFEAHVLFQTLQKDLGLPEDWTLRFDNAKRRFGSCQYRTKTITLSRYLVVLNASDQVGQTIRHEIAHALVGPGHGHNHVWRAMAIKCGDDGQRCYSSETVNTPQAPYAATCTGCGKVYKRHRRPRTARSCGACGNGRFNPALILTWSRTW